MEVSCGDSAGLNGSATVSVVHWCCSPLPFVLINVRDEILARRASLLQHHRTAENNYPTMYCSYDLQLL